MTATGLQANAFPQNDLDAPASWKQNDNADLIVKTGKGILHGILCTAAGGTPTLAIYDGTDSSGTVIVKEFTPVAGTYYRFHDLYFGTGLFLDVGGTTVELTTMYK